MPDHNYFAVLETALAANGAGSVQFQVPANEHYSFVEIWVQSTGAFNVTGIRDAAGRYYTNASPSTEITGTFLQVGGSANYGLNKFIVPLEIAGAGILYFDLEDTSGAPNTVTILLQGVRTTP